MSNGLVACPDCGAAMVGRPERCAACGLVLVGEVAARLWVVDQSIAALSAERIGLLRMLRAAGVRSVATPAYAPPQHFPHYPATVPHPSYQPEPGRPRMEWSRRRVQNLLLSLGVLLLTVAALIFIAVNWGALGAGGRDAVMAAVTLSAAAAATVAARRALPATAESVAVLTVALLIVDGVGLRLAGLAGDIAPTTYAGAVSAAIALLTGLWATRISIRAPRIAAILAAELVLPLVTGTSVMGPAGVAAVHGLQVAALLAIRFHLRSYLYLRLRFDTPAAKILRSDASDASDAKILPSDTTAAKILGATATATATGSATAPTPKIPRTAAKIRTDTLTTQILRITTYIWWALALLTAVGATYGHADHGSAQGSAWGPVELAALAAIAVWAARQEFAELHLALATATGIATLCAPVPHLDAAWRAPAVEAAALLGAAAVLAIPTRVARASTAVVAATGLAALLTAVKPIAEALTAPKAVTGREVWKATWPQIRSLHATDAIHIGQPWSGNAHLAVLAFGALATAVVLMPRTTAAVRRAAVPTIAAFVVVNLVLVPLEASWTLPIAVGWELVLGAALLIAAMTKNPANPANPANARTAAIVGGCFLAHASLWSLRSPVLTVTAVAASLIATAIAAFAARHRADDRLVLATVTATLVAVEAALIATYQAATFEQVGVVLSAVAAGVMTTTYILRNRLDNILATALQIVALIAAATAIGLTAYEPAALVTATAVLIVATALVAAAPAAAAPVPTAPVPTAPVPTAPPVVLGKTPLAPAWPALAQVLICLEADAIHRWTAPDADLSSRGLILALAAAVVSIAAMGNPIDVALITGPSIYTLATIATIAGSRLDPVWLALLIGGVAAALIASLGALGHRRNPRLPIHLPAAISPLLLLTASWVRLAESHIHSVEPYTLPAAFILLAAGHLRRRTDREAASWPCYGPGLLLGLAPTLLQALADPGLVRPVLVGAAALAVLAAGIRGRLQAPLAIGAAVLAIDVLAQLSPALAAAYDAVPRWTLIALAGALLLALGVTYERRIRDLRTLSRKFGELR